MDASIENNQNLTTEQRQEIDNRMAEIRDYQLKVDAVILIFKMIMHLIYFLACAFYDIWELIKTGSFRSVVIMIFLQCIFYVFVEKLFPLPVQKRQRKSW